MIVVFVSTVCFTGMAIVNGMGETKFPRYLFSVEMVFGSNNHKDGQTRGSSTSLKVNIKWAQVKPKHLESVATQ